MKKISSIVLWVLFALSLVVLILFLTAEKESVQLTTGQFTDVSTQLSTFLYWMYVVVGLSVVLLILFAIKTIASDVKAALGGLIGVALFAILMIACYFASGETEFSRIVNGETQVFSETTMKMIDMWIYSIYVLVGVTVLLIVGFGAKRLIIK